MFLNLLQAHIIAFAIKWRMEPAKRIKRISKHNVFLPLYPFSESCSIFWIHNHGQVNQSIEKSVERKSKP